MTLTVASIDIADPPHVWERAGFTVDEDECRVGGVRVRLGTSRSAGTGIVGWSLRDLPPHVTDLDGIPTSPSDAPPSEPATHANGVVAIDHVVLFSSNLGRTVDALAAVGATPRRARDGDLGGQRIRQIFFRFGEVIVEVVGTPDAAGDDPSSLWGITYIVEDIDASAAFFGDDAMPVKDAVQPGRRITTLRHHELGLSVRTAMISPPARR
ncbi:glyoxalase [Mycolicibacterium goodii]|uniref:glyoxalase n=1 Tax=Mycolicibacterium goodii TaxID=134601 RepID=UPI001BDDA25D|nr:glyoxalase [Mycolicibacterium goodii]MBU8809001.1 glyoxalase [Mycolicibacterium goodii]MBU8819919.1 glyoxalase [Mycolicibacterium goodii]ULN46668.1 glyoxalase [Mycolicibacterium goodii]